MHQEILEDLLEDCPCDHKRWCFFRELFENDGLSDEMAEQVRLIYDYKYMQSEIEGKDIGKQRAFHEFADKYGKKFHEMYKEGMKRKELFTLIFGCGIKMPTDEQIRRDM